MQESKHKAALAEVRHAIEEALEDRNRGLLLHQRLLMAALSLGTQHMIELWLHLARAIKPRAGIKHEWFQAEEKRLKVRLAGLVTKDLSKLKNSDKILALAREIERERNDIVYGAPLSSDSVLREKIDLFLELKRAVQDAAGDIGWD